METAGYGHTAMPTASPRRSSGRSLRTHFYGYPDPSLNHFFFLPFIKSNGSIIQPTLFPEMYFKLIFDSSIDILKSCSHIINSLRLKKPIIAVNVVPK
jgi:hypothetical protein